MMEGSEKMRQLALMFLAAAAVFGQTSSSIPYALNSDGPGPTFVTENRSFSYPGSYSSIRKVDFRNFRFLIFDPAGKPAESFRLKKGHYQHDKPLDHFSIDLDSIYYLSATPPSKQSFVLVLYFLQGGGVSSNQGEMAQVFTISDGHLRSVQTIDWDTQFQSSQPAHSFDSRTNKLVIRSAHYIPGDAHCCVSAVDIVTFRWDGARFLQSGIETELSDYGKTEKKTLPR